MTEMEMVKELRRVVAHVAGSAGSNREKVKANCAGICTPGKPPSNEERSSHFFRCTSSILSATLRAPVFPCTIELGSWFCRWIDYVSLPPTGLKNVVSMRPLFRGVVP